MQFFSQTGCGDSLKNGHLPVKLHSSAPGIIFDLVGLISPVIVHMKMILQDICVTKLSWDGPLPEELENIWQNGLSI